MFHSFCRVNHSMGKSLNSDIPNFFFLFFPKSGWEEKHPTIVLDSEVLREFKNSKKVEEIKLKYSFSMKSMDQMTSHLYAVFRWIPTTLLVNFNSELSWYSSTEKASPAAYAAPRNLPWETFFGCGLVILPWSLTRKLVVTRGGTCPLTPVTNGSDPRLLLSSSITWIYNGKHWVNLWSLG